jgi:phosphoenolpyruvate carboxykinase (ATP)
MQEPIMITSTIAKTLPPGVPVSDTQADDTLVDSMRANSVPPHAELSPEQLARIALDTNQCVATASGALVLRTGALTGRSPRDRFIVRDALTADSVAWGSANQAISPEHCHALEQHLRRHLAQRQTYTVTRHAGGREGSPVLVTTPSAAHALFATHLFQTPRRGATGEPITILHSPECFADPALHGTTSGTFIVLDVSRRTILIGGTGYAGEMKKAVFSFLNFELPGRGILTMHAAANVDPYGNSAVFFGLSGTGKTTLSADPERHLLGDDEHAWSDAGVFNLEGGCYAKCINLSAKYEAAIWRAVHTPLTVLENVVLDPAAEPIWSDASITENTRAAYSLSVLDDVWPQNVVRAPRHVVFLTADAFGLLPPIAKLTPDQVGYYFLSGYTAKVAGTEAGTQTPTPTFSACFGAPFMPRPARYYARLLEDRVHAAGASVWLVNTGWTGGPYGVGQRMPIDETRRIVHAILSSELEQVPLRRDEHFGLHVPSAVRGVRAEVLDPRVAYGDTQKYDEQARALVGRFAENFARYEG